MEECVIGNKKPSQMRGFNLEAPTRFELVMEILQTSALPLGDGAIKKEFQKSSFEYQRASYLSSAKSCQGRV